MMFTELFTPKLTIVNQPVDEIAAVAVSRIINMIENKESKKRNNILKCNLLIGESVKRVI